METQGDRVRNLRDERKWSMEDLAAEVSRLYGKKVNWQSIQNVESGKTKNPHFFAELCIVLGVSSKYLRSGKEQTGNEVAESNARYSSMSIQAYDEGAEFDPARYAQLRVVSAELSAGTGAMDQIEYEEKPLPFLRPTLREAGVTSKNAVIVRIIGTSMEPVLTPGDTVGVDTGSKQPIKNGDAYALRDIDMVRVKLLYRRPGGGLRIRSYNRDEYPDEDLTADEVNERITIIGRVFWSSRMW